MTQIYQSTLNREPKVKELFLFLFVMKLIVLTKNNHFHYESEITFQQLFTFSLCSSLLLNVHSHSSFQNLHSQASFLSII